MWAWKDACPLPPLRVTLNRVCRHDHRIDLSELKAAVPLLVGASVHPHMCCGPTHASRIGVQAARGIPIVNAEAAFSEIDRQVDTLPGCPLAAVTWCRARASGPPCVWMTCALSL